MKKNLLSVVWSPGGRQGGGGQVVEGNLVVKVYIVTISWYNVNNLTLSQNPGKRKLLTLVLAAWLVICSLLKIFQTIGSAIALFLAL